MHIILVNPPNHQHDVDDLAPPLGLLVLADALMEHGFDCSLLDLNLLSCRDHDTEPEEFLQQSCSQILSTDPDLIAFTSMAINSHVSLELARRLKVMTPETLIVLGGSHFSSVADKIAANFDSIDYIVRGEGEIALVRLCQSLDSGTRPGSRILETVESGPIRGHPWSAYPLVHLADYFDLNPRKVLDFESGRGCKYKCRFCYSPDFWQPKRSLDAAAVGKEFTDAFHRGVRHLFVVQDNFLNDRNVVEDVCAQLARLQQRPTWNCYATLPDVHDETPTMLANAGCTSVYFGIDAVTPLQQRAFGKAFARNQSKCIEEMQRFVAASVIPTCSFILDPQNWSDAELESSFQWALQLRLVGAELSFHLLTEYPGTSLDRLDSSDSKLVADDFRIRLMFDCPPVVINNPAATRWPSLFPFHSRKNGSEAQFQAGVSLVHVAQTVISGYPHELADMVASGQRSIVDLLRDVSTRLRFFPVAKMNPIEVKREAASLGNFQKSH